MLLMYFLLPYYWWKWELGPMTNTIIDPESRFCTTLRLSGYPDSCLMINFYLKEQLSFLLICTLFMIFILFVDSVGLVIIAYITTKLAICL